MYRGFVYLFALILPVIASAETFKITVDRTAHLGSTTLRPGEYRVTIEMETDTAGKAEFVKGKEKFAADVKREALPSKAPHSYIRYANGTENKLAELVQRGDSVRWLFN